MSPSVLVDDDLQVTKLVTSILGSRGYEVRTAAGAEAAMASIGARAPALILTDLEMPGMNGIELCRRVRDTSNVPIIVMSGHADCASEVAALDSGADDSLVKPFVTDRLLARVRTPCYLLNNLWRNGRTGCARSIWKCRAWRSRDRRCAGCGASTRRCVTPPWTRSWPRTFSTVVGRDGATTLADTIHDADSL